VVVAQTAAIYAVKLEISLWSEQPDRGKGRKESWKMISDKISGKSSRIGCGLT
jgi:hypothetical protein